MEGHVIDEPLADDPDPASVMQGVTVLAPGSHKLVPSLPPPDAARRISYPKTAPAAGRSRVGYAGSGLAVARAGGYCAATILLRGTTHEARRNDAPVSDWQSTWTISAARGKYVRKPVKYLVLTHHHMDHAGGIRAYADTGASIVTGPGTAANFRRVLAAPFTRNPVLSSSDLGRTPIVEVMGKHVLGDGQRQVELYVLDPDPHADGLLIGYIPDAKLGFVTDVWSPGAGPLPDKLTPALAALVAGVKKAGITPAKFAGGHGTNADYAPLAALEGK